MIYVLIGVIIFSSVAYLVLRSSDRSQVQTKEEKRFEILNAYTKELREALEPLGSDKEARIAKKQELFKRFSAELSQNIFFDNSEIRDILVDLSQEV
jgi:hypothetical protein